MNNTVMAAIVTASPAKLYSFPNKVSLISHKQPINDRMISTSISK